MRVHSDGMSDVFTRTIAIMKFYLYVYVYVHVMCMCVHSDSMSDVTIL